VNPSKKYAENSRLPLVDVGSSLVAKISMKSEYGKGSKFTVEVPEL
jgi:hypothetical protein